MEIWKDVKDYEGFYQVSDLGRVKSLTRYIKRSRGGEQILRGKILTIYDNEKYNYYSVGLSKNGVQKTHSIHSLVAKSFLIKPDFYSVVIDHINNNSKDNRIENLRYCTQRENLNNMSIETKTGYVGVSINPPNYKKRYRARIRINEKMKELGSYETAKEAGQAYFNEKYKIENE